MMAGNCSLASSSRPFVSNNKTFTAGGFLVLQMDWASCCCTALGVSMQGPVYINKSAPTFPRAFASLFLGISLDPCGGVLGPRDGLGAVGLDGETGFAWAASWRKMRSLLRRIQRSSSLPSAEKLKLSSGGALGLRPRLPGLESSRRTLAGGSRGSSGADLLPCSRDGNLRILMSLSESVNSNSVPV